MDCDKMDTTIHTPTQFIPGSSDVKVTERRRKHAIPSSSQPTAHTNRSTRFVAAATPNSINNRRPSNKPVRSKSDATVAFLRHGTTSSPSTNSGSSSSSSSSRSTRRAPAEFYENKHKARNNGDIDFNDNEDIADDDDDDDDDDDELEDDSYSRSLPITSFIGIRPPTTTAAATTSSERKSSMGVPYLSDESKLERDDSLGFHQCPASPCIESLSEERNDNSVQDMPPKEAGATVNTSAALSFPRFPKSSKSQKFTFEPPQDKSKSQGKGQNLNSDALRDSRNNRFVPSQSPASRPTFGRQLSKRKSESMLDFSPISSVDNSDEDEDDDQELYYSTNRSTSSIPFTPISPQAPKARRLNNNNDPYQLFEVQRTPCLILTVNVLRGRNITNGFQDYYDTPDPYINLYLPSSPEGRKRTTTKDNSPNPVWNEELTFYINFTQTNKLKITLMESNMFLMPDQEVGTTDFDLSCIRKMNETQRETFIFNEKSEVDIEFLLQFDSDPTLRYSLCLSDAEKQFQERRKEKVFQAMRKLLGQDEGPANISEVPNIAVIGSGGGFRALTGYSGVFKALMESGVIDCTMYAGGLSGSSWLLSTLYSHPEWPNIDMGKFMDELMTHLEKKLLRFFTLTTMIQYAKAIVTKRRDGQPVSFTDIFGRMVGETLLPGRMDATLTDQREKLKDGGVPMPLYTCVHVKKDVPARSFQEWVEFSPYEIGLPKYGTFMDSGLFGSKFFMGKLVKQYKEQPLHFLQGIWGSAFCILFKRLLEDNRRIDPTEMIRQEIKNKQVDIREELGEVLDQASSESSSDCSDDDDDLDGVKSSFENDLDDVDGRQNGSFESNGNAGSMDEIDNSSSLSRLNEDNEDNDDGNMHEEDSAYEGEEEEDDEEEENLSFKFLRGRRSSVDSAKARKAAALLAAREAMEESEIQDLNVPSPDMEDISAPEVQDLNVPSPDMEDITPSEVQDLSLPCPNIKNISAPEVHCSNVPSPAAKDFNVSEVHSSNVPSLAAKDISAPEVHNSNVPSPAIKSMIAPDSRDLNASMSSVKGIMMSDDQRLNSSDGLKKSVNWGACPSHGRKSTDKRQAYARANSSMRKSRTGSMSYWKTLMKGIVESKSWEVFSARRGRAAVIHNFMRGLSLQQSYPLSPFTPVQDRVKPGDEFDGNFEMVPTSLKHIYMVDAGLTFNSPYPLILRPQREVDIILSFDFSARPSDKHQPFKELLLAEKWANLNRLPFPPIDLSMYNKDEVKELYIFKDPSDPHCPVVFHFVLVNNQFKYYSKPGVPRQTKEEFNFAEFDIFDDPKAPYSTFSFTYTQEAFKRLSQLTEFNTLLHIDEIKEEMKAAVKKKRQNPNRYNSIPSRDIKLLRMASVQAMRKKLHGFMKSLGSTNLSSSSRPLVTASPGSPTSNSFFAGYKREFSVPSSAEGSVFTTPIQMLDTPDFGSPSSSQPGDAHRHHITAAMTTYRNQNHERERRATLSSTESVYGTPPEIENDFLNNIQHTPKSSPSVGHTSTSGTKTDPLIQSSIPFMNSVSSESESSTPKVKVASQVKTRKESPPNPFFTSFIKSTQSSGSPMSAPVNQKYNHHKGMSKVTRLAKSKHSPPIMYHVSASQTVNQSSHAKPGGDLTTSPFNQHRSSVAVHPSHSVPLHTTLSGPLGPSLSTPLAPTSSTPLAPPLSTPLSNPLRTPLSTTLVGLSNSNHGSTTSSGYSSLSERVVEEDHEIYSMAPEAFRADGTPVLDSQEAKMYYDTAKQKRKLLRRQSTVSSIQNISLDDEANDQHNAEEQKSSKLSTATAASSATEIAATAATVDSGDDVTMQCEDDASPAFNPHLDIRSNLSQFQGIGSINSPGNVGHSKDMDLCCLPQNQDQRSIDSGTDVTFNHV